MAQPTASIGPQLPQAKNKKPMPQKKERDLWWAFLLGKPESEWDPPKRPKNKTLNKLLHGGGARNMSMMVDTSREAQPSLRMEEADGQQADDADDVASIASSSNDKPDRETENANALEPSNASAPTPFVDTGEPVKCPPSAYASLPPTPTPREPTPSLLRRIDERYALHLLMYFTHWINLYLQDPIKFPQPPTGSHARWIFSLLGRVEDQISADDQNLLRNLVRACLGLLKTILSTPPAVLAMDTAPTEAVGQVQTGSAPMRERDCWIVIATIVEVWAQRDLWEDADEMLSGL
ncbi:hypothetical protein HGRIS_009403 [Hohenbuehelia grisea]